MLPDFHQGVWQLSHHGCNCVRDFACALSQGLDTIRTIQRADKEEVHTLCFSPFRSLMVAVYDNDQYWLVAETAGV